MDSMESLHNEFERYFNDNQEKINYFLDVLKNVKEDKWEYSEIIRDKYCVKQLKYDNIVIKYCSKSVIGEILKVHINSKMIYVTNLLLEKIDIEVLAMIERAEKRAKGE